MEAPALLVLPAGHAEHVAAPAALYVLAAHTVHAPHRALPLC